jgi:hypothetical protein
VRKVLGASVSQIVSLLSKDFLFLVLLAFALAAPLTWWALHSWLENYAYRTEISWWIFGATVFSMFVDHSICHTQRPDHTNCDRESGKKFAN